MDIWYHLVSFVPKICTKNIAPLLNLELLVTYLCKMEFPALKIWTNPFCFLKLSLGSNLQCHPNSKSTFCKQTLQNMIRRRIHAVWRLIWFCTVCLCLIIWTLGLLGYEAYEWLVFTCSFLLEPWKYALQHFMTGYVIS